MAKRLSIGVRMEPVKTTAICSYLVSLGLFFGDLFHWLNANAAACGVILAFLTWISQTYIAWHFKNKEHKLAVKGLINRRGL